VCLGLVAFCSPTTTMVTANAERHCSQSFAMMACTTMVFGGFLAQAMFRDHV
jgi:hypothetical protein